MQAHGVLPNAPPVLPELCVGIATFTARLHRAVLQELTVTLAKEATAGVERVWAPRVEHCTKRLKVAEWQAEAEAMLEEMRAAGGKETAATNTVLSGSLERRWAMGKREVGVARKYSDKHLSGRAQRELRRWLCSRCDEKRHRTSRCLTLNLN
eukprot:TRINITY_DN2748_c0_g1_i1.p1 TRINITY_DN2748_c0_g1~~TRINITY_DN2748_c0_g1_i1.p1  ORF type:complete len:153 (+),score=22.75 TRINITY_DN2748_c0_g1_i1:385-843(+)